MEAEGKQAFLSLKSLKSNRELFFEKKNTKIIKLITQRSEELQTLQSEPRKTISNILKVRTLPHTL